MANQFRSNLKKNDRFSWILDDLLLNSVVEPESSAVKCRSVLKVWNLSMTDENGFVASEVERRDRIVECGREQIQHGEGGAQNVALRD